MGTLYNEEMQGAERNGGFDQLQDNEFFTGQFNAGDA